MSTRIVLIGAGSAMFGLGTVGDILRCKSLEGSTIVLNDINPEALAFVEGVASRYVRDKGLPFKIEATTSLDAALKYANFCMISIEVGDRHTLWEEDWKVPMQYGFRQVYGENGGPGGLFHALRIIPPILGICERISAVCPDAFVFNLSNPMVRISQAVHTKFPHLKYVGICHEVASLIEHLKKGDMATQAERLLADTGWLPEPLRTPHLEGDAVSAETHGEDEALPEFLIGDDADAADEGEDHHLVAAE